VHYLKPKLSNISALVEGEFVTEKRAESLIKDLALEMVSF
jgi:hypothetical protein